MLTFLLLLILHTYAKPEMSYSHEVTYPLVDCKAIEYEELCEGYPRGQRNFNDLHNFRMCVWNEKSKKCKNVGLDISDYENLCEILDVESCFLDARCNWNEIKYKCEPDLLGLNYGEADKVMYPPYILDVTVQTGLPVVENCEQLMIQGYCKGYESTGLYCMWSQEEAECVAGSGENFDKICDQYDILSCANDLRCFLDEFKCVQSSLAKFIPYQHMKDTVYPPYDPTFMLPYSYLPFFQPPTTTTTTTTTSSPTAVVNDATMTMPATDISSTLAGETDEGTVIVVDSNEIASPEVVTDIEPSIIHIDDDVFFNASELYMNWPTVECAIIETVDNCHGISITNNSQICIWNMKTQSCLSEAVTDFTAICNQYDLPPVCTEDIRCDWDIVSVQCAVSQDPIPSVPFVDSLASVYPPYLLSTISPATTQAQILRQSMVENYFKFMVPAQILSGMGNMWGGYYGNTNHENNPNNEYYNNGYSPSSSSSYYYPQNLNTGYYQPTQSNDHYNYQGYNTEVYNSETVDVMTPSYTQMNEMNENTIPHHTDTTPYPQGPQIIGVQNQYGQLYNVYSACELLLTQTTCIGFGPDMVQMCMWDGESQFCHAQNPDNFPAICRAYTSASICAGDARCDWSPHSQCVASIYANTIVYERIVDVVYPPYNPLSIMPIGWSPEFKPPSNSAQYDGFGNDANSPELESANIVLTPTCKCRGEPDNHGLGATCAPSPGSSNKYFCVVVEGVCGDQMASTDHSDYWYSFKACENQAQHSTGISRKAVNGDVPKRPKDPQVRINEDPSTTFNMFQKYLALWLALGVFMLILCITVGFCFRKKPTLNEMIKLDLLNYPEPQHAYSNREVAESIRENTITTILAEQMI